MNLNWRQLPKTEVTKQRMSEAKLGRSYTPRHKLNMAVSQILLAAQKRSYCPVLRIQNHPRWSTLKKRLLLTIIKDRNLDYLSDKAQDILNVL